MTARRTTLLIGIGLLAIAFWLGACASTDRRVTIRPQALRFSAPLDSIGLATFDSLTVSEQRQRRATAVSWRARADEAPTAESRLRALRNVVGLTPDDCIAWIDLAEISRWFGWRRQTGPMLAAALEATRRLDPQQRPGPRRRIAMLRAWIIYDRGQWRQGLALLDSVPALEESRSDALLVRGLLLAGGGQSWDATHLARQVEEMRPATSDWRWIRSITDYFRDMPQGAVQQFGDWAEPQHRSEYWNDRGMALEVYGRLDRARTSYDNAFDSLPLGPSITIRKHEPELPDFEQRYGHRPLPVWLVFDCHYVLGSHLTAAEMHYRRYLAAVAGPEREAWGDLVMDESEICVRRLVEPTRMRAMRGRVQLDREHFGLAEASLRRADTEYRRTGDGPDLDNLANLAHLLLVCERHFEAIPLLEELVEADNHRAEAWSDLGFARVMRNDVPGARHALDRAVELDSGSATAWYNRGMLFFNLQQWQAAITDFERAAVLAPGNEAVVEILQRARLALRREENTP